MHGHPTPLIRAAACALFVLLAGASRVEAAQCSVAATSVVFGTYNVFSSSPVDSTGTIVLRCNGGARNVLIAITKGQSLTFVPRQLAKATEKLAYNLFLDAARTSVWGDFSGGTSGHIEANPPNNQDLVVTVYGRIPPGQDISAGSYSDSVTVVVNF
jgi:spore coat protein U-like protein